ncbi:DUF1177 domain-containing protein [Litchfieldia alkalitelluris]|uniref:DUF1177 domain-containing protein n=1 Tax=Litchfieldia alkalitelluris TaxID=304268 RepID=UPI000996FFE1|nr:DUF1177 domain-containing protein [Litchfieldia alkalitelluris]
MLHKYVQTLFELLDDSNASGEKVEKLFSGYKGVKTSVRTETAGTASTDYIKVLIPGVNGKTVGGSAPTLGVIGRLGGLGARPSVKGFVSDGDGALGALTVALKLADMQEKGDNLEGDVIVITHIDPDAPTKPHFPVPFMGSAIDNSTKNGIEIDQEMDAILSIDTTKGNRVVNHTGISITPTVKEGYILRVSEELMDIYQNVTGHFPVVLPITTQDITPYGNDIYHINSILQPSVATTVPVVGVAITTVATIAGCATGATNIEAVEQSARYCIEVAKLYTEEKASFYNKDEYQHLIGLYGSLSHLQTQGKRTV